MDVESHRRHADGILLRAAQNAAEARGDERTAKQIAAEKTREHDVIERAFILEQREAGERIARRDREAVVAAVGASELAVKKAIWPKASVIMMK